MVLKDNLYNITRRETTQDGVVFTINLNPYCDIYAAHFPGMPITPGVCVIKIAEELLGEVEGKELRVTAVRNAKFIIALEPDGKEIYVIFKSISEVDNTIVTQIVISDKDGRIYARISMQAIIA